MYYLLQHEGVTRNGRVFDMRGMLPPSEARMRMCVMKVGERGRWTYRDWIKWHVLWKFLHRTELHALVLGGPRQEGAGLLFRRRLTDAAHDVGEGIGAA